MPFYVISEHAEEHVCPYALGSTVMDRPDMQAHRLHGAESPFNVGKAFVGIDRIVGRELVLRHVGTHGVQTVTGRFSGNGVGLAAAGETNVRDFKGEMLGHLVTIDHPSNPYADLCLT